MKLYHGSPRKLEGKRLLPRKGRDVFNRPDNLHKAVYATDVKKKAIAMSILSCNGVKGGGLDSSKKSATPGIIYKGFPEQEYVFLHTLSSKGFEKVGEGHQFISKKPVEPIKTEKLRVSDYLYLIRKASQEEIKKWNEVIKISS
ncbi:MAG: hypothetical protein KKF68_00960 [Nanoarchaeota archaeon]|nr:hypothetical protein [Nanoarchaeota archaeon]